MKATELMIGDWVYLNYWDGKYKQQIHCINYNSWRGEGYADWVDTEIDDEASINNIEPIPLTPEILEKNGWKEAQSWHEYQDGKNTIQSCLPDMRGIINEVEIQHFKCGYVHQYQHLLRLCGLETLADNFKV